MINQGSTMIKRFQYLKRIYKAYLSEGDSQLTFWHGTPAVNEWWIPGELGQYYMSFIAKANYSGQFDSDGVPKLDYHGNIGVQYNPIAIAQYGLGNFNLYCQEGKKEYFQKFIISADWLAEHLEKNEKDIFVWMHHFNFEYRDLLNAPWYSGLAQGQGLSVLVRAYTETREMKYLEAVQAAYEAFSHVIDEGGVLFIDEDGNSWIEEYLVHPPTHVLNGFIWAAWGIYDYYLTTSSTHAENLYNDIIETIKINLHRYDIGFWSLYELSGTKIKMLASPFYHSLHIVQLRILYQLTNEVIFHNYAEHWQGYQDNNLNKARAFLLKVVFKLFYY